MSLKRTRKKRSLPDGPPPPRVAATVAWLDSISMDVTPITSNPRASCRRVDYLLTVKCQDRVSPSWSTWHLVRSFDEFRFFRKRLVAALHRGHFCQAECPWLYTFLKSYYPKSQLVGSSLSRVVARRRKTLTRSFATIRSFLLNRSNHVCPRVMQGVARELLEFVVGESQDRHGQVPEWLVHLLQRWQDGDVELLEDSTSSDETTSSDEAAVEICALCENPLVGRLLKDRRPEPDGDRWSQLAVAEPFSMLSCGHHFHDECLIDKLNEALKCPTCGHHEAW
ncbi:hypothetical protein PF005_g21544 [Phytophthora fragariae]|uniref:RING-type domain-containing protein n=1 Tax=Phytophthora fragariae TaxID=53985 RepID=A0A6A3X9N5_9STRA|nr:hypothetical protein PF003_g33947 [Phytophthora fragariae]KAE8927552.1 hypothetical protein PF009_g22288 [Phytophthora fragariae]KAE8979429.1 hypothetical protein PF011_g22855 [Phytophthora fragariae]KAE9075825.1 hypothetical protein PF010_g24152 [Phytophthora fragariae]KAE9084692.1 hypothetical protein PF007_g21422 [Phytophthora fragariae]